MWYVIPSILIVNKPHLLMHPPVDLQCQRVIDLSSKYLRSRFGLWIVHGHTYRDLLYWYKHKLDRETVCCQVVVRHFYEA